MHILHLQGAEVDNRQHYHTGNRINSIKQTLSAVSLTSPHFLKCIANFHMQF